MIANEISLFLIGAGIGVLLNLSLRPKENAWKDKMAEADESIRAIIQRMAERIRTLDRTNYDGSCFLLLEPRPAATACPCQNTRDSKRSAESLAPFSSVS